MCIDNTSFEYEETKFDISNVFLALIYYIEKSDAKNNLLEVLFEERKKIHLLIAQRLISLHKNYIEIVIDMFNTVDQYDRVILFSGDGDFERAIELLRSKNTHITVVSTEGMIARELRNATDRYIDLNDIRDSIEKMEY